jgi:spermidine synthase
MSAKELFADKPKIIYSTSSAHSGVINVWKHKKGLVLEVGGYPQSVSLDTPTLPDRYWFKAANTVARNIKDPKRALIIGIGGATIFHLLAKKFPDLKMTGIEIDPEVIDVARRFFDLDKVPNLKVVVGDGQEYVVTHEGEHFDLTFIDAYLGGNFPLHFEEKDFLAKLKEVTRKDGLVVINRASGFDKTKFENLLNKVFATVEVVKIPLPGFLGGLGGNYLYLCR